MAEPTACQTPGATFNTWVDPLTVMVSVDLPFALALSEEQAKILEANMHNAVELVLAPYFVGRTA